MSTCKEPAEVAARALFTTARAANSPSPTKEADVPAKKEAEPKHHSARRLEEGLVERRVDLADQK